MSEQESSLGNRARKSSVYPVKQGQVTWDECRDAACRCTEKIHAAKVQLELKWARNVGDNKKRLFQIY